MIGLLHQIIKPFLHVKKIIVNIFLRDRGNRNWLMGGRPEPRNLHLRRCMGGTEEHSRIGVHQNPELIFIFFICYDSGYFHTRINLSEKFYLIL